jgi:hypothetical protein
LARDVSARLADNVGFALAALGVVGLLFIGRGSLTSFRATDSSFRHLPGRGLDGQIPFTRTPVIGVRHTSIAQRFVEAAGSKEIGRVSLTEALELTILIAHKDPRRHPRVAARWLLRFLEERSRVTIDEAVMVATCLAALGGDRHKEASRKLREVVAQSSPNSRSAHRGQ